jgi:predicted Zn-ribbon and HTH transcriptional regulator
MAEIENGGPGDALAKGGCPICKGEDWTSSPLVFMRRTGLLDTGFGLTVKPFVCNNCGYVALMLAHDQPLPEALDAIRRSQ